MKKGEKMLNIKNLAEKTKLYGVFKILLSALMFLTIFSAPMSIVYGQAAGANAVLCDLYSMYTTIDDAIFIIALVLMLLGGALYAAAHVMPGQSKGTLQGYGMGMILGGVIGVILAILLPYIFSIVSNNSVSNITTAASTYCT